MRRFIKIVAGAAVLAAATATGAQAIQVVPKAGGNTARFPAQPYIADNDQVTRGNPSGNVNVHGSCFGARNATAGNNLTVDNPSIPATPTATLLGEYPYGATQQPPINITSAPAVNPTFAGNFLGTTQALAFGPGIVQIAAADANNRATLMPVPEFQGTPTVTYRGEVEYLVYSDSYSTGPIDLDLANVNGDGSYDIFLNTAGLGVDTYTIRFLGCRNVSATTNAFERQWRINYYQGTPAPLTAAAGACAAGAAQFYIASTYNCAASATTSTSYIPTNILPPGGGTAGQVQLGFDTYRCNWTSVTATSASGANSGAGTYTVTAARVAQPLIGPAVFLTGQASGRGPNESSAPSGSFLFIDNFTCGDFQFQIPPTVLPLTSGYNGNGDLACSNRYNNNQQFAGAQFSTTPNNATGNNTSVLGFVANQNVPVIGSVPTAPVAGGDATGNTGASVAGGCPSGYDPVGIRANSIYDYYARFQVVGGGANVNVPTNAAGFVAPTSANAAAAAQQQTAAVIVAAGGTPAPAAAVTAPAEIGSASCRDSV